MANTIQLKLLDNKRVECLINGLPYAYEGGYRIVAGEENATIFEISSKPKQYENAAYSITLTNSAGTIVPAPELVDNKFTLPAEMAAYAGYGSILITALYINGDDIEKVVWTPIKVKIWPDNIIPSQGGQGGGGEGGGANFNPAGIYLSLTAGKAIKDIEGNNIAEELANRMKYSDKLIEVDGGDHVVSDNLIIGGLYLYKL